MVWTCNHQFLIIWMTRLRILPSTRGLAILRSESSLECGIFPYAGREILEETDFSADHVPTAFLSRHTPIAIVYNEVFIQIRSNGEFILTGNAIGICTILIKSCIGISEVETISCPIVKHILGLGSSLGI